MQLVPRQTSIMIPYFLSSKFNIDRTITIYRAMLALSLYDGEPAAPMNVCINSPWLHKMLYWSILDDHRE
jgi:hypothetical protein